MNHRKSEHPSSKICRYFKDDCCQFTGKDCWYRHESKTSQSDSDVNVNLENSCKDCDEFFVEKSDLMKHRKIQHMKNISKCRDFTLGKCSWNSNSCWLKMKIWKLTMRSRFFARFRTNSLQIKLT